MKEIRKMTNEDSGFYEIFGPVFGSREIQRKTGDRFYDDAGKEWYVKVDGHNNILAVVSISENDIKNVYGDEQILQELLEYVLSRVDTGIVPILYLPVYKKAGYSIEESGQLKRFVKIYGGKHNE